MSWTIAGKVYLDAGGMGEQVGLSRSAVLRLARLKKVPYYVVGRRWLFEPHEFMAARRTPTGDLSCSPDKVERGVVRRRRRSRR
jgi:hypothetical protein